MALKLMYITNRPKIAQIAEAAGVDRIFIDLETIGKSDRQKGMDTVQSCHTLNDIKLVSEAITSAEVLVRINPIHDASNSFISSEEEIDIAIRSGADVVMLPFYKTNAEVKRFIEAVSGRAKAMLLLETPEAVEIVNDTLALGGIDSIHIGLNDLSLGYGKKFMFELLTDGTVEKLCLAFGNVGIPYGFGGIASLGKGMIPAEMIIREHYRLGSSCAILSRSFCNAEKESNDERIKEIFTEGIRNIRAFEEHCSSYNETVFHANRQELSERVKKICEGK